MIKLHDIRFHVLDKIANFEYYLLYLVYPRESLVFKDFINYINSLLYDGLQNCRQVLDEINYAVDDVLKTSFEQVDDAFKGSYRRFYWPDDSTVDFVKKLR